jgi:hypothetical protein
MKGSTILCALSHGLYEPWLSILKEGQEKTWLIEEIPQRIKIIHYHANPVGKFGQYCDRTHEKIRWTSRYLAVPLKFLDDILGFPFKNWVPNYAESDYLNLTHKVIAIDCIDTYVTYRWKILSLFDFFLKETSHDYLMTTTTSSYINTDALTRYVDALPLNDVYTGSLPYDGALFVSGSNRILSRDVVGEIMKNRRGWRVGTIEDLELGRLVKRYCGLDPQTFPIQNIQSEDELAKTQDNVLKDTYHFRLKSGTLSHRNDVSIMKALHERFRGMGYFK